MIGFSQYSKSGDGFGFYPNDRFSVHEASWLAISRMSLPTTVNNFCIHTYMVIVIVFRAMKRDGQTM